MESLIGFGKCTKGFFLSFFWYPTLFDLDFQAANIQSFYVCVYVQQWIASVIAVIANTFCVSVCARSCARQSFTYGSGEPAALCPSPPADAELVTVYWFGNIWHLYVVCSRLAEIYDKQSVTLAW